MKYKIPKKIDNEISKTVKVFDDKFYIIQFIIELITMSFIVLFMMLIIITMAFILTYYAKILFSFS